jgi:DNA polymerase III delta prime subunit
MSNLVETYLWIEKFRPTKLDQLVLPDDYRIKFEEYAKTKEIPHCLFFGPPGTGKTTIARILVNSILRDTGDLLMFNGSSSTGVDVMRNIVDEFLKVPSFSGGIKLIFIDESDYLSQNAQAALRNMTETYHEVGRFIFTCNYLSKILEPLQSRFQMFEFKKVPLDYILNFCKKILDTEKVKYDEASVKKIISTFYPDIRKIVNKLQARSEGGELRVQTTDLESNEKMFRSYLTDLIKGINENSSLTNTSISNMLKLLSKVELDYVGLYQEMFNDDYVPIWAKIVINKSANEHASSMLPGMNLMSCIYQIAKIGKELKELRR